MTHAACLNHDRWLGPHSLATQLCRNMRVQFDDATTSGSDPIVVAYRRMCS